MQVLELPGQVVSHRQFVALQCPFVTPDVHRNLALDTVAREGIRQQLLASNAGHLRGQERQIAVAGDIVPIRRQPIHETDEQRPADDHRQPVPDHELAKTIEHDAQYRIMTAKRKE